MIEAEHMPLRLTLNGQDRCVDVRSHHTLLQVLQQLGLTGTKETCGEGECGACTILLDGRAVNACLILALEADGADVVTVEGLADGEQLDPLQESFIAAGAVQCGYCTPGMLMAAKYLLLRNSHPTTEEIKEALAGNLCRCTGYGRIVQAVHRAASGADQETGPSER